MSTLEAELGIALGGDVGDIGPDGYASMLASLLPPGRLWQLIPGASTLYALLLASADELSRVHARIADMLNEADPSTAIELLPEYERELNIAAASTTAERQARVAAREVARQRFPPLDFQVALAPLLALDPSAVVVIERTRAFCIAVGDDREIFRFFIYRNPALPGAYFLASAQAQIDRMKPSHTVGHVIESTSMLYGDPHSLYGRDIMGP